jgi:hypothetical protein
MRHQTVLFFQSTLTQAYSYLYTGLLGAKNIRNYSGLLVAYGDSLSLCVGYGPGSLQRLAQSLCWVWTWQLTATRSVSVLGVVRGGGGGAGRKHKTLANCRRQ